MQFSDIRFFMAHAADLYTGEESEWGVIAADSDDAARRLNDCKLMVARVREIDSPDGGDLSAASMKYLEPALQRFENDQPFAELMAEHCRLAMASEFDSRIVSGCEVDRAVGCEYAETRPDRVYSLREALDDPPMPYLGKCNREPRADGQSWCACGVEAVLVDFD